jgi:predicted transposase YbfD/YdcC
MDTEQIESAIWFQKDAAYLYSEAAIVRERNTPTSDWVATQIQNNAANSARLARQTIGIEV